MRHDPLYMLWNVGCSSPEVAVAQQKRLTREIDVDTTIVDEIRPVAENDEAIRQSHRLGDYFESVRVFSGDAPESFRVLFQRRRDAGRFWKDFMARLLQTIRTSAAPATTRLESAGDEKPDLS